MKQLFNIEQYNSSGSNDLIDCSCSFCKKDFKKKRKLVYHSIFVRKQDRLFCTIQCCNNSRICGAEVKCKTCGKLVYKTPGDLKKVKNSFCSSSCAATCTNKNRVRIKKPKPVSNWPWPLNRSKVIGARAEYFPIIKHVQNFLKKIGAKNKTRICIICGNTFEGKERKTCGEICYKQSLRKGGLKSAENQSRTRRSRNESLFYDKCLKLFPESICNINMFNGWDADIILPKLKIAVLWNGKWHYEKITKKHSVLQVQNRDFIKNKEIESCGFIAYTIKDMGKFNPNFVDIEFKKFLEWLRVMELNHL